MPFIAIAAVIMLALGGGVTVAADQAKPGEALYGYKMVVNDNLRHEYHALKASFGVETDTKVEADAGANASGTYEAGSDDIYKDDTATTSATSSASVHGNLRVRDDASDEAKAIDEHLNADGSIQVNVY